MGKTAAERQRARRARIRADPAAYALHKKADCYRKAQAQKDMSPEEVEYLRERQFIALQKHR